VTDAEAQEQAIEGKSPRAPRRAAIIGLSWIGGDSARPATDPALGTAQPFSHASAMAALPEVELVAVCDISIDALRGFNETWRGRWPNYREYEDYRALLKREALDILSVVTPDHLHTEIVLAAIKAGVKAIYCEKPLATTLEDADRMILAAREAGTIMNINHTRRWSPDFRLAKKLAHDGSIGRVAQIITHQGGNRAMLYRNGSHFLDLVTFLADAEPRWVVAETDPGFEDYGTIYRGNGGGDATAEPGYNCYIAYRNGVRAFVSDSKQVARDWAVEILGSNGRIAVTAAGTELRVQAGDDMFVSRHATPNWTMAGMEAALSELVAALDGGSPVSCPPEAARASIALAEAILKSQQLGNVPVLVSSIGPEAPSRESREVGTSEFEASVARSSRRTRSSID
jgi:predicted dehydrogenase